MSLLSIWQLNLATASPGLAPTITINPSPVTVQVGQGATFFVSATNASGYQWYLNSSPVVGATASSLTLSGVSLAQNGSQVYCVVSNVYGSTTSASASLTVLAAASTAQLQTSGSFGVTAFDTRTLIDRAYGALGISPQEITPEMITIAQDLLGMVLADLLNDAAPLWTVEKYLATVTQGQQQVVLPRGTNDLRSALFRTMSQLSPTVLSATSSAYVWDFLSDTNPTTIAVNWSSDGVPISIQSSPDNITWTTKAIGSRTDTGKVFYDIDNGNYARYWRIIPTPGLSSSVSGIASALAFNTPSDIPMYRMNQDQYLSMVNKTFQGKPLQYWLDRQLQPTMTLWPAVDAVSANGVVVVWRQRYIMDVGTLQQTLELPTRWFLAMVYLLAQELAPATPKVDAGRLAVVQTKAAVMLQRAWLEERDKSPFELQINLSPYTR